MKAEHLLLSFKSCSQLRQIQNVKASGKTDVQEDNPVEFTVQNLDCKGSTVCCWQAVQSEFLVHIHRSV